MYPHNKPIFTELQRNNKTVAQLIKIHKLFIKTKTQQTKEKKYLRFIATNSTKKKI